MKLTASEIKKLPVYTKSGEHIGRVLDIVIDNQNHAVFNYSIARKRTLAHLLPSTFLVSPLQVITLDNTKMVVEDTSVLLEASISKLIMEPKTAARFSLAEGVKSK